MESNSVSKRRQFALNGGWLARPFRQAHPGKCFPKTGLPERLRHPALGSIASLRYDLSFGRAENGWPHTRERVEDPIPPSNERQKPRPAAIEESRFERNACEGRSGSFVAGDHRANSGDEVAPIATLCLQNPIA